MAQGFWNRILRVDLTDRTWRVEEPGEAFFRTYMGGSAIGTYYLLTETAADLDPLDPANVLTLAGGVTTGAAVSGASRFGICALSPLTGLVGDSQSGGLFGPMLKRTGYDAIVVTGRAANLTMLTVEEDQVEFHDVEAWRGELVTDVLDHLDDRFGKGYSAIQCGPAGERLVRFACLMVDRNDVGGRTGLGAVFGSKNLRAVVVRGKKKVPFAEPKKLAELNRTALSRLPNAGFPTTLNELGTPGVVSFQASAGNLATHNYSKGFHPEHEKLDGSSFESELGAGATTCYGCVVRCRKKVKSKGRFPLTDKLGGPEFETLGMLGSNLDVTDVSAVARASQLCGEYGVDTLTMGGLAGYLFECMERGLVSADQVDGKNLRFGDPDDVFWLIEQTAKREGVGDVLAEGFVAAIDHFGKETEPYAIHVKNQGLAVHMPQVKPSQAIMYAVSPIGPDHQSCEHDWLIASGGQECRGLGILGEGTAQSTNLNKVRMTAYSQFFYSMTDTLCLCQFVWGPGNLFRYSELETFVSSCTGWDVTLWELMKVGERRINMMRHLDARRGFGRVQDWLPKRVFEPLPDGPSQGRHVDEREFPRMLDDYYGIMGWDLESGNPTPGKLRELGLEWALDERG
ncbi:MAG: aldehyde ferredoxin oxidoreductase family protein [Deltaproteobacteria bacterium]|nr:aldehyde ferredoxin oxidoreductase family protein [Deltaproteobacteria bacterium]